jgi:hypothetical protein
VREVALIEELERDLHRLDGHDLSAELDEARTRVHGVANGGPPRQSVY